jgi:hypothetical protein
MRRTVACLFALVLLSACGGRDEPVEDAAPDEPDTTAPSTDTTTDQAAGPPGEPPVTEEGGPPAAWLETPSGSAWMAYGNYCWGDVCMDILRPTCDDSSVPEVELRPGGAIRFHLPFVPDTADLTLGASSSRPQVVSLEPARVIEWQGVYDGLLWLALTAEEGEVAYQACARMTSR